MKYTVKNNLIEVEVETKGAEMMRITSLPDRKEYLSDGNPKYWSRRSPVLFPVVGLAKDKKIVVDGQEYPMAQHGFARDSAFEVIEQTESTLLLEMSSDEDTRKCYPYDFKLQIGYELDGADITVRWKVINTGDKEMHYQIGAHPAFCCPVDSDLEKQSQYFMKFDGAETISYRLLDEDGLVAPEKYELATEGGLYAIPETMFDRGALIIEGSQNHTVSLCRPDKKPYVTVKFDAPLYGVWSPIKLNAPFICIEPWHGRADNSDFAGEIQDRDYDQALPSGETKEYVYTICV